MKEEIKKKLSYLVIFLVLFIIGLGVKTLFYNNDYELETNQKPTVQEEVTTKEKNNKENSVGSIKTIKDKEGNKYKVDNTLKADIPEALMKQIPKEKFLSMMQQFLDQNKLMTKGTTVKNDGSYDVDVKNNSISFLVTINDSRNTPILVTVKNGKDISFSY